MELTKISRSSNSTNHKQMFPYSHDIDGSGKAKLTYDRMTKFQFMVTVSKRAS